MPLPHKAPFIRTAYGPKKKVVVSNTEPSLAKQSMAEECDINNILRKHQKTGLVTHINQYQGRYDALPNVTDYHEAMTAVVEAQQAFESLPSSLRTRFGNDPSQFLNFVQDESNADEIRKLGLAPQDPEPSSDVRPPEPGAASPTPQETSPEAGKPAPEPE